MTWSQLFFLAAVILIAAFKVSYREPYRRLVSAMRGMTDAVRDSSFKAEEILRAISEQPVLLQSWQIDLAEAESFEVTEYSLGGSIDEALEVCREEDDQFEYKPLRLELVHCSHPRENYLRLTIAAFAKSEQPKSVEGQWCAGAVKETT